MAEHLLGSVQVSGFERYDDPVLHSRSIDVGEVAPPAPLACFGRDELVERVIKLAENLTTIALIGVGGIGKTSIALTVLHHDRIKERFGYNRRFIHCDQFSPSRANFLRQLSQVIGAGVENPDDLTLLRPFLTSEEMLIVLDNAESVLDPQGSSGEGINAVVEELSQFSNIWLCITSCITAIPPYCETIEIPTLSMEAAREAFYNIYKYDERSDSVNNILEQLEFHPLSVTLLATIADQNEWNNNRLAKEWGQRQTGVLQEGYNKSLGRTIELSLISPLFGQLDPDARELLGVVAFFPQGIDENNLDWLFPTTSDRTAIFDTFSVLSLTYRNNGFITMPAILRDYLRPQDPMSSPLLRATRDRYFDRMSIEFNINEPMFGESKWITSEDLNTEHLLNVFASFDANADEVWNACADFIQHLRWHKPRRTVLRQKIEALPDDHPEKTKCLFELAKLFGSFGNYVEQKQLFDHILKLDRRRGDDYRVAVMLMSSSEANRKLGLYKEGIEQMKEALTSYQQLESSVDQARCHYYLSFLFHDDKQPGAAKEAISQAIYLLPEGGEEFLVCQSQCLLGRIYRSEGEREKAVHHFEQALAIASSFEWHTELFCIHYFLAVLFLDKGDSGSARAHAAKAKSHTVENPYHLVRMMELQALSWCLQGRLEEARSEALRASETNEKLAAARDLGHCRDLIQYIEQAIKSKFPSYSQVPISVIYSLFSARDTPSSSSS